MLNKRITDNKSLPTYWDDELKGFNVFGVIEDTLSKFPYLVDTIKEVFKEIIGKKQMTDSEAIEIFEKNKEHHWGIQFIRNESINTDYFKGSNLQEAINSYSAKGNDPDKIVCCVNADIASVMEDEIKSGKTNLVEAVENEIKNK